MADFLIKSRHSTTYHFRRKVPADLAHVISKTHLVVSLKTGNHRQALIRARLLAAQTDATFMRLRSMSDSESKPDPLEAFAQLPNCRDLIQRAGMRLRIDEMGKELELRESEVAAGLARQQEQQKQHAEELVLAARAAVVGAGLVSGGLSPTEEPRKPGMPFKDAIEEFLAGKKATTQKTYRGRLVHAMAFFGEDADVRYIDQEAFAAYAAHVRGDVPNKTTAGFYITTCAGMLSSFFSTKGWGKELTTKRLVEKESKPDSEDRDGFTLEQTEVIFRNAEKYRKSQPYKYWVTVAVPFLGCRLEELAQINLSEDVRQDKASGVWYLDFNARPDADGVMRKSIKNKASWRCVPIHSALVQLGFVEYLNQQKVRGFSRPFESGWEPLSLKRNDIESAEDAKKKREPLKWSHYISGWGGRELRKLIKSGKLPTPDAKVTYFHSYRHLLSGLMSEMEVPVDVAEALIGHEVKGQYKETERYRKVKKNPVLLSRLCVEPGLKPLARLLDIDVVGRK